LIETTISRDVLLLNRVDKPALVRSLFHLGCVFSGQILSFNKMLGQLQDAGNTTTLAHYLELLSGAGMLTGLKKYTGQATRLRGSSPKRRFSTRCCSPLNRATRLTKCVALLSSGGRWVESAVGAHLTNAAAAGQGELSYWRDRDREVDFVFRSGRRLLAIEVKNGRTRVNLHGATAFATQHKPDRLFLVGGDGIPLQAFLSRPVTDWI
jgi:hypothetical protein